MNLNLNTVVVPFLIISMRVSMVVLFAPLFGSVAIPPRIKAIVVIVLTVLLYPLLAQRAAAIVTEANWAMVIGAELAIGIAMGIITNLLFESMQLAGQVLSVQMGYSLINILDPQTQVDTTVMAVFHMWPQS